MAEIAINSAPIANTEYSPFYLNYGYHPTFWWDLPQAIEPTSNDRTIAVRKHIKNMKEDWHVVRDAIDRMRRLATERANSKRQDYDFKVGQEVLINQRKYYKGRFGTDRNVLAPKAAGPFTIVKKISNNTVELKIPALLLGKAKPVFHSSVLIPYESRVLDPEGMIHAEQEVLVEPPAWDPTVELNRGDETLCRPIPIQRLYPRDWRWNLASRRKKKGRSGSRTDYW